MQMCKIYFWDIKFEIHIWLHHSHEASSSRADQRPLLPGEARIRLPDTDDTLDPVPDNLLSELSTVSFR